MKRLVLAILSILLCILMLRANLLWRVEGPDIKSPSYIFGTHHVAPVALLDSIDGFDEALASVDAVYGELDMARMMTPAAQQQMMGAAMAPQDSLLTMVLTPAQVDSLDVILKKYLGPMVSAQAFAAMKPAMVQTVLTMTMNQKFFPGFNAAEQLDAMIQQRARQAGKTVGGLETLDDQCVALFGAPITRQAKDLMEVVADDDKASESAHRLADAYLSGDLDAMFAMINGEMDDETALRMIYNRNDNWVGIIAGRMASTPTMYVVGAGHLPGQRGLIEQLRAKGFTVNPVK